MDAMKRGAKCHDIMDKVGDCWNQRLNQCLKKNGYTQETFAKAYKKRYGTGNQATVYRWVNVGNTFGADGKKIGLPSYDTMKRIADFFHVTVGYLTGETDYETFEMERACKYLEITEAAGKAIKKITGTAPDCMEWGRQAERYQHALNIFITSEHFPDFIQELKELDDVLCEDLDNANRLDQKYGKATVDAVRELKNSEVGYDCDPSAPELTALQKEVWNALEKNDLEGYENSFKRKVARYELHEAFERLIDSLYPSQHG